MSFQSASGIPIQAGFERFDHDHPQVFNHFCRIVRREMNEGHQKISGKFIINEIRWEVALSPPAKDCVTTNLTDSLVAKPRRFKINDAYASRYVRKYLKEFPEHALFFEMRGLRS